MYPPATAGGSRGLCPIVKKYQKTFASFLELWHYIVLGKYLIAPNLYRGQMQKFLHFYVGSLLPIAYYIQVFYVQSSAFSLST